MATVMQPVISGGVKHLQVDTMRKPSQIRKLSYVDKKILKVLLNPGARPSSQELAARVGIPRTTVQRRRNYLEEHFLEFAYSLKLQDLPYRRVELLIHTGGGSTTMTAERLLDRDEVVCVAKSIGEHTVDLKAEVVVKDNSELLDLIEEVKCMDGVIDVIWTETIKIAGRKRSVPSKIIENL